MDQEKKAKSGTKKRWSPEQIELLLELWAEKVPQLRGTRRNSHVFSEMKAELESRQCFVSAGEIKVRIHNLTSKYRKEKAKIGPSGGSPSLWPLYHKVHNILGGFAINNVSALIEESIVDPDVDGDSSDNIEILEEYAISDEEHADSDELTPSQTLPLSPEPMPSTSRCANKPAGKKERKNNFQAEILKRWDILDHEMKQQEERIRYTDERMLQLEERRTDLLEKVVNNTTEIKDAFIYFVNAKHDS